MTEGPIDYRFVIKENVPEPLEKAGEIQQEIEYKEKNFLNVL